MTLRAAAAARVRGLLDPWLLGQIKHDLDDIIEEVLAAAFDAWHATGFFSFDCTK